jgi:predicted MFS family arabinose efflux permease
MVEPGPEPQERQRLGRVGIASASLTVMIASTVWPFTFGVLAPTLIDELALTPSVFGIVYSVYYLSAVLGSPLVGNLADRLHFRSSILLMSVGSAAHLALFAASRSVLWLFVGASLAGVVMAAANPFTNSLIAASLKDGDVRLAVAVKQSGVPISAVLVGWMVPLVTGWFTWRIGVLSLLVFVMLSILTSVRVTGSGPMADLAKRDRHGPIEPTGLEVYAFMLGIVSAGINGYLPLFANIELAGSLARGGALLAAFAAAGAFGRAFWSMLARSGQIRRILTSLPAVGGLALFGLAFTRFEPLVWLLVIVAGLTVMAWQGIGTLAIMDMRTRSVARTSGRMLQYFYAGFVIGAPLMGLVVDRSGYTAAWSMLGIAALIAWLSMLGGRHRLGVAGRGLTPPVGQA